MKTRVYSHHKLPTFDTKHQLMSAEPLPVVKFTLSNRIDFQYHFYYFCLQISLFENHLKKNLILLEWNYPKFLYSFLCLAIWHTSWQKNWKKVKIQFVHCFESVIKNAKNHQKWFPTPHKKALVSHKFKDTWFSSLNQRKRPSVNKFQNQYK